jgi:hypothetical protein
MEKNKTLQVDKLDKFKLIVMMCILMQKNKYEII